MTPLAHPAALLLGVLAALALLALGLRAHARPGLGVRVVGQRPLTQACGLALVALGLGLGFAEPRWGLPERPRLTVHVVVDASRSMLVEDAGGRSRWATARASLDRLWSRPELGLRWSLDLLTGDAIPVLPPGEDRALLRESLAAVTPGALGSPGTSLGRGLPQVIAEVEAGEPAVLLLLSDGEETWETPSAAQARALKALRGAKLPLLALAYGDGQPHAVPGAAGAAGEPLQSAAQPASLRALAEASGGRLFANADEAAEGLLALAAGQAPLPAVRSQAPSHPELGAWLALAGLALWLSAAGLPMARWRPILGLLLLLGAPALRGEAPATAPWAPASLRAWMAQRALEAGDLPSAMAWRPRDGRPAHRLLAAQIQLRAHAPEAALRSLAPLVEARLPRPLPDWRVAALLLAARAQVESGHRPEAEALLERLLLEAPGQPEAVHDLQSLRAPTPPRPPKAKQPPPPPPRPSLGARPEELEGLRRRLPPPKPQGGVKDL